MSEWRMRFLWNKEEGIKKEIETKQTRGIRREEKQEIKGRKRGRGDLFYFNSSQRKYGK